jgi:hypothetical protein
MTVRRVAVVVAAFVLALAGCSGDDPKEQSQATSTTEERHSLISYRGLSAVRTGVSPGRWRPSGAKGCVLRTHPGEPHTGRRCLPEAISVSTDLFVLAV